MRVLMLSWEYPPRIIGGISPHVQELSKELVELGIEVHVITKETPSAPHEETEPCGVHVHRVALNQEPDNFIHEIQLLNKATELKCRELLEKWKPDGKPTLLHAHDWLSLDAARELKYKYKLPVVATIHATEKGRNGGIYNDMQRYIHEQEYWLSYEAWRIIVCSEFMKSQVIEQFQCPIDKIDVIYNGIDSEKLKFNWTEKEHDTWRLQFAEPDEKIVMYVGRFVREKGVHVLLNAIGVVLAQEPKTKFVIVGGGHREHFERFAEWYGIKNRIHFTGFMSSTALYKLYKVADVATFPSLYEPFGIVALEGMAAGIPVVASNAGGLNEVVLHNKTGTSSYAGDAQSLAWAILRTLQDEKRAHQLVEAANKRLEDDFNWEKLAQQTKETYEKVWKEFLSSHWCQATLWPLSPGSHTRAPKLKGKQKGKQGGSRLKPFNQLPFLKKQKNKLPATG